MDMKLGNRTIHGVGLVETDFKGVYPAKDSPAARKALQQDGLVLTDEAGKYFMVHKAGMYNREKVYAGRGTTVEIDGKTYTHVHNINHADTTGEKITRTVGGFFSRVGFEGQMLILRARMAFYGVIMGAGSR